MYIINKGRTEKRIFPYHSRKSKEKKNVCTKPTYENAHGIEGNISSMWNKFHLLLLNKIIGETIL
jgi:hypothetical protein